MCKCESPGCNETASYSVGLVGTMFLSLCRVHYLFMQRMGLLRAQA